MKKKRGGYKILYEEIREREIRIQVSIQSQLRLS